MKIVIDVSTVDMAQAIRDLIEKYGGEAGMQIEYSKLVLRIGEAPKPETN